MGDLNEACERTVDWMLQRVINAARGDNELTLNVQPEGRFWLGRLASQQTVINSPFGDRSERMEPCAIGIRLRPAKGPPWELVVEISGCAWSRDGQSTWRKTDRCSERIHVSIDSDNMARYEFVAQGFQDQLRNALGQDVLRSLVAVEIERGRDNCIEIVVTFVNDSPDARETPISDTGIYESQIRVEGLSTVPFLLESLPDSFRYDRRILAYGINCGVEMPAPDVFVSTDAICVDRFRPEYWASEEPQPDLTFDTLATVPLISLRSLAAAHSSWGEQLWSRESLDRRYRDEQWTLEMLNEARIAGQQFLDEAKRIANGLRLLERNQTLRRAFQLMNAAMGIASRGKYDGWRPFQAGFLLANLSSVLNGEDDTSVVDILWFATGGGKTETYLGLLLLAAFYDRLTGKLSGITAWSRFPLRLLSLQQTQRFADAIAGAEVVRRQNSIDGDPFALGFFVGEASTPNRLKNDPAPNDPDPLDDSMPGRYQVLLRCPFCDSAINMAFDRRFWRLQHQCVNDECPWPEDGLPIYIVDEEIYRFLPTLVVGTLDKVASISMQASMRGFVSSPYGKCTEPGHGFTYAPRAARQNGCLVPGCRGNQTALRGNANRFPPTFRLQDELHLLRDSLGAVDAHYESLLDHLQVRTCGVRPKIVASSATLTGYESQCETLYQRTGRIFPLPGPTSTESFWTTSTNSLLRRYVALAPRGATLEFAADRLLTEIQIAIRELLADPITICAVIGIDPSFATTIGSLYGTNVVYGNTIRDIDASIRSLETQVPVSPLLTAQLTGHTPFDDVRSVLERLQQPEERFEDRLHVIAASSMMSHGVDVDRLNTMVMLGLPLATAEFIQATARIGRARPGIAFVLHKMALERDASIHRSFKSFVEHGDRFIDAIPVTRRSRRVLERTLPGIIMARILQIHEPSAGRALTLIPQLRQYFSDRTIDATSEILAVRELLQLDEFIDLGLCEEIESLTRTFFTNLYDLARSERFPNELFATATMRSLRDVEEQAPIYD